MDDLQAEAKFFHDIAGAVIELVKASQDKIYVAEDKGAGDYSTQVDIDVENLIVSEIGKLFPGDQILAEEAHADTEIVDDRLWLIDPICGTSNIGKGINNFCTNIALAKDKELIASCVIDHSQGDYFWSVGDGGVFVNDKIHQAPAKELGVKIDVDFGSVRNVPEPLRRQHNNFLMRAIDETDYDLISLNTSLGMAYTAIGKTDGLITMFNHPWDICAASFLIQQAGGVISDIDGSPWKITTVGAIAGRTPEIHQNLLDIFLSSRQ